MKFIKTAVVITAMLTLASCSVSDLAFWKSEPASEQKPTITTNTGTSTTNSGTGKTASGNVTESSKDALETFKKMFVKTFSDKTVPHAGNIEGTVKVTDITTGTGSEGISMNVKGGFDFKSDKENYAYLKFSGVGDFGLKGLALLKPDGKLEYRLDETPSGTSVPKLVTEYLSGIVLKKETSTDLAFDSEIKKILSKTGGLSDDSVSGVFDSLVKSLIVSSSKDVLMIKNSGTNGALNVRIPNGEKNTIDSMSGSVLEKSGSGKTVMHRISVKQTDLGKPYISLDFIIDSVNITDGMRKTRTEGNLKITGK